MYRHGDILLRPASEPQPAHGAAVERTGEQRGELILALGEATGHAHRLTGALEPVTVRERGRAVAMVHVAAPSLLTHEEHGPLMIPPGWYEIIRQRVYTPASPQWVRD